MSENNKCKKKQINKNKEKELVFVETARDTCRTRSYKVPARQIGLTNIFLKKDNKIFD